MDKHTPVLLREAVEALNVNIGGRYVDCTFGFGGHTAEILKRGGQVLALDVESVGYEDFVNSSFSHFVKEGRLIFRRANFAKLDEVLREVGWEKVDGILYDLGTSAWELAGSGRGFTYLKNEPLDMRLDQSLTVTAADLVNGLNEKELYEYFKNFGEEPGALRFARSVGSARRLRPIKTTLDLVQVLGTENPEVLARIFQALRIAVNNELANLQSSLTQALGHLKVGGRIVVISFHSLEDRIIKRLGQSEVTMPSEAEVRANPRARSAKMRVLVQAN